MREATNLDHSVLGERMRAPLSGRELEVLELLNEGLKAKLVATRLGLHEVTVRSYIRSILRKLDSHSQLEALAVARHAGLVGDSPAPRLAPAPAVEPRNGHAVAPRRRLVPRNDGYRLLAEILAGCVSAEPGAPGRRVEEAGEAWGRYLADRPPLAPPLSAVESVSEVLELLTETGFHPEAEPEADGVRIILRSCPFAELARVHREVVCAVHLGLIRGALDELGGKLHPSGLTPFAEPGACELRLVRDRSAG